MSTGIGRWSMDSVSLWHGSSSFWSVVSCGDALTLRWRVMNTQRTAIGKIKMLELWVSDLRNPALVITEMLGGGEFSANCLHGEQMFNNRLLSWADYDIMHLRLNKSRLEIQHNLAVRVNDHWNSFTKACGMWAVTSTFRSPDNNFHCWKALSFKQELICKSPLSSAVHEVSQPTHPSLVCYSGNVQMSPSPWISR